MSNKIVCSVLISILIFLTKDVLTLDEFIVVNTDSGPVRGKSAFTLFDQKPFYAFKGIPYAEPPLNSLRFKEPHPIEQWKNVKDAFDFGNNCLQWNFDRTSVIGNEDCLFINVYTTNVSPTAKLPVMFFIHGGAYHEGSGNDDFFGPDFLLNENVILVTFNYRLGPLGFLSLGTPEYSGNMGLKDQQYAMKWIRANIKNFGGDKANVTIFGHSAGAASTHFHVISPSSRGLFQRAIIMSGTALNTWSYYAPAEHLLYAFHFAQQTQNPVYNYQDLVKYLHRVDGKLLVENFVKIAKFNGESRKELEILMGPVVEHEKTTNPFMDKTPEDIFANYPLHNIDTMFGFTSAEMLFFVSPELNNPELLQPFDEVFQIALPHRTLQINYNSKEYKRVAKEIRDFYFGEDGSVNNETLVEYLDLISDLWFVYHIDKSVKAHGRQSIGKTFYYRFSVDSKFNLFKTLFNITSMSGASHGDELCYLFRCHIFPNVYDNVEIDSTEMKALRQMTQLWTNFAKHGNPTPNADPVDFKPIAVDEINFVDIRNEGLVPALSPHSKFLNFWDEILEKYENLIKETNTKDEL